MSSQSYAHHATALAPARPLEIELAEIRGEYEQRDRADLERCKRLAALWPRWQEQRNPSKNDFLRQTCPDFDARSGSYFRHLFVGVALNAGYAGNMRELEPLGWALITGGHTPADLRAQVERDGLEAAGTALRLERSRTTREGTTVRRMPESAGASLDALSERLQGHPDAPVADTERRGLLVRMLEAMPEPLFAALATTASTGEHTLEGLTEALSAYQPDFYEELKRDGCLHPQCQTRSGIQLHHMAHGESTKRAGSFLVPLCPFHHAQDGSHDHAHAMTRDAFYALWGGEVPFLWAVWERYAQAAQAVRRQV